MSALSDKENHNQNQIEVGHDEIADRAWQFWEGSGQPVGRDADYWLQAEVELLGYAARPFAGEGHTQTRPQGKTPGRLLQPLQAMEPAQK